MLALLFHTACGFAAIGEAPLARLRGVAWGKSNRAGREAAELAKQIADLRESRRAIVDAFEIERKRIEGDLHDGAQQYLVATGMKVGEASYVAERLFDGDGDVTPELAAKVVQLRGLLAEAQRLNESALGALRHTVREVHPQILSDLGLEAALHELIEHTGIRPEPRLVVPHKLPAIPNGVASTAYFLISEALTNVVKHAPGATASVVVSAGEFLNVSVVDDGPGNARIVRGHGLYGLSERLAAFGGVMRVSSPPGGPTAVEAKIPLLLRAGESGLEPIRR